MPIKLPFKDSLVFSGHLATQWTLAFRFKAFIAFRFRKPVTQLLFFAHCDNLSLMCHLQVRKADSSCVARFQETRLAH